MHAFGQREQERTACVAGQATRRCAVDQHLLGLPALWGLGQGERRIGLGVRLEPDLERAGCELDLRPGDRDAIRRALRLS